MIQARRPVETFYLVAVTPCVNRRGLLTPNWFLSKYVVLLLVTSEVGFSALGLGGFCYFW